MTKAYSRLAVIPARGGSKRLRNKNILPLAGKPIVVYTIEAALKSQLFNKILLSTDSESIASIGKSMGVEIYKRPKKFASDAVGVMPALSELMTTLEKRGEKYDIVCQMLPTCLFRKVEHLKTGMRMLDKKTDSVIGVTAYDFPIKKALKQDGDRLKILFKDSPWITGTARTQDQEVFYHDNGAFYISWWKSFKKYNNFFRGKIKGYEIHPFNAQVLDNEIDYIKAQLLLDYMKKNPNGPLTKWLSKL